MKQKIAIDIRLFYRGKGIASYINGILYNYQKYSDKNSPTLILISDREIPEELRKLGYEYKILPLRIYPIFDLILPFFLWFNRIETLHSPGNTNPLIKLPKQKFITTIHDLIFFTSEFGGNTIYQKIGRLYLRFNVKFTKKYNDKIISVSEYSKNDIARILKIPLSKIHVIYQGFSDDYRNLIKKEISKKKEFLAFGSLDARKNTVLIIKAFKKFSENHPEYILNLVGIQQKDLRQIRFKIKNWENIKFHGFIDNHSLLELYQTCVALVYPSLYEGFGIPIIEAQSCNTAVITSNITSTKEIAGNSALLIDPYSEKELIRALESIISISVQKDLVLRGEENIQRFLWENIIDSYKSIYQ